MAVNNVSNGIANNPLINGSTVHGTKGSGRNAASGSVRSSGTITEDSVEITAQAQKLAGIQSKIKASPDVDMGKVSAIKSAISNGSYKVDGEAIAEKMVGFETSLAALYG